MTRNIDNSKIEIRDTFWSALQRKIADVVLPHQWKALNDEILDVEPSHSVENFLIAAKLKEGTFYGAKFQDSDVTKWIEAASYSIMKYPNAEIEKTIDWLADVFEMVQDKDGYLNTYYTVAKPGERWSNFAHGHELYCAGHLIEAAVAYFNATGKENLLKVARRNADYLCNIFSESNEQYNKYPGHEEIELALYKLYKVTGESRYFELMRYFIDERGKNHFLLDEPGFPDNRFFQMEYHQAHLPVREQKEAVGHAVRAMYLYIAMADLALETKDNEIFTSLKSIWEDITQRKMYVTGGIGASAEGESFSLKYDLPPDRAYAETCASIGMLLWARRMNKLESISDYADIAELELYNGILSGMSEDGTKFFYVNPLEVHPDKGKIRKDLEHIKAQRVEWLGCACCPPNIARTIASVQDNIYTVREDTLYINQYIGNQAEIQVGDHRIALSLSSGFPWKGDCLITLSENKPSTCTIALRIPAWCKQYSVILNDMTPDYIVKDGYIYIHRQWLKGDALHLSFNIEPEFIFSTSEVSDTAGRVCLRRGPIVYCTEEADNGTLLGSCEVDLNAVIRENYSDEKNEMVELTVIGRRIKSTGDIYSAHRPIGEEVTLKFVPYFSWGNRGEGEMRVWLNYYGL